MEIDAVCKNKNTALLILETVMETVKSDTQSAALKAVAEWIGEKENNSNDFSKLTPGEQECIIAEMKTKLRNCMSTEERREEAAFYLEGLEEIENGQVLLIPEQKLEFEFEPESEYELASEFEPLVRKRGIGVVRTDNASVLSL